jgi:histidinol-phosphate aminotransferase
MELSRRDWIKSTLSLTTGLTLTSGIASTLMATPVSEAEEEFLKTFKPVGAKVRLDSNENPYGPSQKAKDAIIKVLTEINRYPIVEPDQLKLLIANKEGVTPDHVHIGAGSGDILCEAATAYNLEGGRVISAFPTFSLLMNYAELFKATWDKVNLNEKLEHDYDAIAAAIKNDTKLIFICNPNNPSGTLVDPRIVKSFCEDVSSRVPIYCDEAYIEFLEPSQQVSMVELVKKGLNVIVSRTFSKIYGLAGIRIGYIIARPDIVKRINSFSHDIPVSHPAIAAAVATYGDDSFMSMTRSKNKEARFVLTAYLDRKKITYGNTVTNFVFFPAPKEGKHILTKMEEKGYLMRIWDYKEREWCRVSIGTLNEMNGFVKAFDEVIS